VRLHRGVDLIGGGIDLIDARHGLGHRRLDIALGDVLQAGVLGRAAGVGDARHRVEPARFGRDMDNHRPCGGAGSLETFRDRCADDLIIVIDFVVAGVRRAEGGGLTRDAGIVDDDVEHARESAGGVGIKAGDLALGRGGGDQEAIGDVVDLVLVTIGRGTTDLERAFDAVEALAEHALHAACHRRAGVIGVHLVVGHVSAFPGLRI
jgi:hypothetical protein